MLGHLENVLISLCSIEKDNYCRTNHGQTYNLSNDRKQCAILFMKQKKGKALKVLSIFKQNQRRAIYMK